MEPLDNLGIRPLPNLETRFVAANTLIGLELSETRLLLQEDAVQQLTKEIEGIREKYFLANNRQQKLDLEEQEDECRERLKQELEIQRAKWVEIQQREIERKVTQLPNPEHREQLREVEQKEYKGRKKKFDFSFEDARKIAGWKPYDQNASADWFDPEWMFGITDGFDVMIGNPPYVRQEKIKELKPTLKINTTVTPAQQISTSISMSAVSNCSGTMVSWPTFPQISIFGPPTARSFEISSPVSLPCLNSLTLATPLFLRQLRIRALSQRPRPMLKTTTSVP